MFVDWSDGAQPEAIVTESLNIRLLDADFEQRVVQDRVENPHGEHAEPCWRISRAALTDVAPIRGAQ